MVVVAVAAITALLGRMNATAAPIKRQKGIRTAASRNNDSQNRYLERGIPIMTPYGVKLSK
jgi:hypothetical protein